MRRAQLIRWAHAVLGFVLVLGTAAVAAIVGGAR